MHQVVRESGTEAAEEERARKKPPFKPLQPKPKPFVAKERPAEERPLTHADYVARALECKEEEQEDASSRSMTKR